jgi:alkanesulfonate monooxygenase SsuD/methylene tetrahydromethanopterin reductase-like flavin-dependent oxidoreductase (luciferase family)
MSKPFRFAAQSAAMEGQAWLATAKRAEELGYSSLLMPDGMHLLSSLTALAMAAGATTTLHVGTFVAASPLRPPRLAAWDAHSLSVLSGGRFEFGVGTGHPDVVKQAVSLAGQPPTTGAQRLAMVGEAVDALRELDGDHHTPVLIAAGGPKARRLAAAKADIVTIAHGPLISREETARLAADVREAAGPRADEIEFASPIFVVGDEPAPFALQFLQVDWDTLVAHDSLVILRGSVQEMADELQRRRETLGISYFSVNAMFIEEFAPVVKMLAGR